MPRDLTLEEIRSNTLIVRRRGWHYNRGQYRGGGGSNVITIVMDKWNLVSLSLYSLSFQLSYTSPSFSYLLYYIHTELIYSFNSL